MRSVLLCAQPSAVIHNQMGYREARHPLLVPHKMALSISLEKLDARATMLASEDVVEIQRTTAV
jgi:hypothetical protein